MKTQSHYPLSLLAVLLIPLLSGCSPKEADEPLDKVATPSIQEVSVESSAPNPNLSAPPTSSSAAPIPEPLDIAKAERPLNSRGDAMTDLEYLNHLVEQVNESRSAPKEINQRAFKTEAEQLAYEEAQQQAVNRSPIKDPSELVSAGVIKALPPAPAGQRFALDAATGKVVLQ